MAFTSFRVKFFFIGFLFSYGLLQNVVSEKNREYAETQNESNAADTKSSDSTDQESSDSNFDMDAVLTEHNIYRQNHGVGNLTFDSEISRVSQNWANHLAEKDEFEHNPDQDEYGENLYMYFSSDANDIMKAKAALKAWYDEISMYDYKNPEGNDYHKVGHFTQVVWKGSKNMGCGYQKSTRAKKKQYLVCNYKPPGNYKGQYGKNVLRPKK